MMTFLKFWLYASLCVTPFILAAMMLENWNSKQ